MNRRLQDQFPALFRFALGGNAVVAWYDSVRDPASRFFKLALSNDGGTLIWLMATFGAVLMLDVIINDWTPATIRLFGRRFTLAWRRTLQHRHYLLAALAFCYAAQPYVAGVKGGSVPLEIYFYWNCCLNLAVAFLDAKIRSRNAGCLKAYS